jgi:hypothetical protein
MAFKPPAFRHYPRWPSKRRYPSSGGNNSQEFTVKGKGTWRIRKGERSLLMTCRSFAEGFAIPAKPEAVQSAVGEDRFARGLKGEIRRTCTKLRGTTASDRRLLTSCLSTLFLNPQALYPYRLAPGGSAYPAVDLWGKSGVSRST